MAKFVMESDTFPVLVMFMVCAAEVVLTRWFPKLLNVDGENDNAGAPPVPDKLTVASAGVMLVFTWRVPERAPVAVG